MGRINIIGAGLSGLSAALTLAETGIGSRLISLQRSERSQSVLAEGGINAALDTMGENDTAAEHFADTMKGGVYLADPNAVDGLTRNAPAVVTRMAQLGVPFNRTSQNGIMQRSFGGQKKKRTAYAKSSTGKMLMTALIDEVRRYEVSGLIQRYPHHEFIRLLTDGGRCTGVRIRDTGTGLCADLDGAVIAASGGMNGMFPGRTTGTTMNGGDVTAGLFAQGVLLGNPEMMQYHPTTIGIPGKRCLISEAARGEGGRLYIMKTSGERSYFMEEKYPELGNLMPRDVVAREMFFVRRSGDTEGEVMLDMTALPEDTWKNRLSDLREEIIRYLGTDPKKSPIPVHEGIHYFMGGIDVNERHCTNIPGLYAGGECCSQYHGANRLGGNSLLGAIYGGKTAAQTAAAAFTDCPDREPIFTEMTDPLLEEARADFSERLAVILSGGLGIVRSEKTLTDAVSAAKAMDLANEREKNRLALGLAMLTGALERRESRGAHYREDYPGASEDYRKTTVAQNCGGEIRISFRDIPERRTDREDNA